MTHFADMSAEFEPVSLIRGADKPAQKRARTLLPETAVAPSGWELYFPARGR